MNGHYYKKQNKRKNEASFYSPSIFNFHYIYILSLCWYLKLEPSYSVIWMLKNVPLDSYQARLLMRK